MKEREKLKKDQNFLAQSINVDRNLKGGGPSPKCRVGRT